MVNDCVNAAVADSGLKQKYIADRLGMSEPAFSALLSGKRKITVDEFFALCGVLGKTPNELYYYGISGTASPPAMARASN